MKKVEEKIKQLEQEIKTLSEERDKLETIVFKEQLDEMEDYEFLTMCTDMLDNVNQKMIHQNLGVVDRRFA